MKTYNIYKAGSTKIGSLRATCISKAAKQFIATLDKPAKYELTSREMVSIRFTDNHSVTGDFVMYQE